MKTDYTGIDYASFACSNRDKNGIRFGVIPQNSGVLQTWCDESEGIYPETENESEENDYDMEPMGFIYKKDGYFCSQSDSMDIFIEKSPYYTFAQFCSPCAPGACYLLSPLETPNENNKCYCFGLDWFENESDCPYDIYDVKTNELIFKAKERE